MSEPFDILTRALPIGWALNVTRTPSKSSGPTRGWHVVLIDSEGNVVWDQIREEVDFHAAAYQLLTMFATAGYHAHKSVADDLREERPEAW